MFGGLVEFLRLMFNGIVMHRSIWEDAMEDKREKKKRPIPPVEYCGRIVAWNQKGDEIIAVGDSFSEVKSKALETGETRPRDERLPPADARFVGNS